MIDLHCDTIWKLMDLDRKGDLMENGCSINIPAMRQAGTKAQFFACFTYIEEWKERGGYDGAYRHVKEMIHYLKGQTDSFANDMALALTYEDLQENAERGKISACLTVEEGGVRKNRTAGGIVPGGRAADDTDVEL